MRRKLGFKVRGHTFSYACIFSLSFYNGLYAFSLYIVPLGLSNNNLGHSYHFLLTKYCWQPLFFTRSFYYIQSDRHV